MVQIGPVRDSTLPVELTTVWIGNAERIPLRDQRRFIAAATSELERVRAACSPTSPAQMECVAKGWGGRPACEAGT